jgi:hypothetical protein
MCCQLSSPIGNLSNFTDGYWVPENVVLGWAGAGSAKQWGGGMCERVSAHVNTGTRQGLAPSDGSASAALRGYVYL